MDELTKKKLDNAQKLVENSGYCLSCLEVSCMEYFAICIAKNVFWIRVFGYGINLKKTEMLWSERYNFTKNIKLPFGFRLVFLNNDRFTNWWVDERMKNKGEPN